MSPADVDALTVEDFDHFAYGVDTIRAEIRKSHNDQKG